MANQNHGSFVALEEFLQPVDGRDIQMVGGLIEQKKIRVLIQEACESGSHFPAAAQGAHGPFEFLLFKPQADKDLLCQVDRVLSVKVNHLMVDLSQFGREFHLGFRVRSGLRGRPLCSFSSSFRRTREGIESSTY